MCLILDKKRPKKVPLSLRILRKRKYYKILGYDPTKNPPLRSPFYDQTSPFYDQTDWIPGTVVKSNRVKTELLNVERKVVDYGIHVYTTKKAAKYNLNLYKNSYYWSSNNYEIHPVTCYCKDFVAVGRDDQAVFTKVTFPK